MLRWSRHTGKAVVDLELVPNTAVVTMDVGACRPRRRLRPKRRKGAHSRGSSGKQARGTHAALDVAREKGSFIFTQKQTLYVAFTWRARQRKKQTPFQKT